MEVKKTGAAVTTFTRYIRLYGSSIKVQSSFSLSKEKLQIRIAQSKCKVLVGSYIESTLPSDLKHHISNPKDLLTAIKEINKKDIWVTENDELVLLLATEDEKCQYSLPLTYCKFESKSILNSDNNSNQSFISDNSKHKIISYLSRENIKLRNKLEDTLQQNEDYKEEIVQLTQACLSMVQQIVNLKQTVMTYQHLTINSSISSLQESTVLNPENTAQQQPLPSPDQIVAVPFTQSIPVEQNDPLLMDNPDNILLPVQKYTKMKEDILDWQLNWQQLKTECHNAKVTIHELKDDKAQLKRKIQSKDKQINQLKRQNKQLWHKIEQEPQLIHQQ